MEQEDDSDIEDEEIALKKGFEEAIDSDNLFDLKAWKQSREKN